MRTHMAFTPIPKPTCHDLNILTKTTLIGLSPTRIGPKTIYDDQIIGLDATISGSNSIYDNILFGLWSNKN
jgi:hypothetical protein